MSGVMVKTAIYGLIRMLFEWSAPAPHWWGLAIIGAGVLSALLGVLYALMERDLKRVLAYSTVEQLGIIAIGLGAASALESGGHQSAAALALVATLVHLLNHSLFKSLLFLGAGAVEIGSGSRDLERLGGLVRRLPRTAGLFLVGALSIAALPPLNGFAGEWLLLQSLLRFGVSYDSTAITALAAASAGALALTAGLGVVCFVRAFGIGFLGEARSTGAQEAHEVGASLQLGMALLAAGCLVLGVATPLLFRLLEPVTESLAGAVVHPGIGLSGAFDAGQTAGHYSPALVVVAIAALGLVPWAVARAAGGAEKRRVAPPWVCGIELEPRMPYTATAFAKPLRIIFQFVIQPVRRVHLETTSSPYFVRAVAYEESISPIYDRYLYRRLVQLTYGAARRIRPLQSGSVRIYLTYIFVTLVVLVLLAR
jgi:hydrogenase-4 component B